jgi:hypothetical protein
MTHLPYGIGNLKQEGAAGHHHRRAAATGEASTSAPIFYMPHLPRLEVVRSGPHASLISQRWNRGEETSLLEILDAALEIVEGDRDCVHKRSSSSPTGSPKGRE